MPTLKPGSPSKLLCFLLIIGDFYDLTIADIGLRQIDYVKDDCSPSKLLCFSLIIGDFYDLKLGSHKS